MSYFLLSSFKIYWIQTDSELACEEAARLTAELQETPDDDDSIDYDQLPPPPDGGVRKNFKPPFNYLNKS